MITPLVSGVKMTNNFSQQQASCLDLLFLLAVVLMQLNPGDDKGQTIEQHPRLFDEAPRPVCQQFFS
jgi:hypothetical protein